MGILGKKEDKNEKAGTPEASSAVKKEKKISKKKGEITTLTKSADYILRGPRITEKAAYATVKNAYVFMVAVDATKRDIVAAIKQVYHVTPVKVNIVRVAPRKFVSPMRRRRGTHKGYKKAYVFLKKGDKIDTV